MFWMKVLPKYPDLAIKSLKTLLLFPTSHSCEFGFSVMAATKTKPQNRLDVMDTLRVSLSSIIPMGERLVDKPGQSFILAGFILSLPRPDPCGSEHLFHRERPVATQHSLRNCVDHLAALSHIGYPIRCKFGLLCTLIDQSRGNDSITFRFFGALAFLQLLWFLSRL